MNRLQKAVPTSSHKPPDLGEPKWTLASPQLIWPPSVDIWCGYVAGGWSPYDLDGGMDESLEALVLWASTLGGLGCRVRVYHNSGGPARHLIHRGVHFLPHNRFEADGQRQVLVTWGAVHPWRMGAAARLKLHWSLGREPPWHPRLAGCVDRFVFSSVAHRQACPWVEDSKALVAPWGVDLGLLDLCWRPKRENRALYAGPMDTGLEQVLTLWSQVYQHRKGLELEVICPKPDYHRPGYGRLSRLLAQPGVMLRDRVSRMEVAEGCWKARYRLFGVVDRDGWRWGGWSAARAKSAYCGAVPVAAGEPPGGEETPSRSGDPLWRACPDFALGADGPAPLAPEPVMDWLSVVQRVWEPLFKGE